jgi:hypothetical protein
MSNGNSWAQAWKVRSSNLNLGKKWYWAPIETIVLIAIAVLLGYLLFYLNGWAVQSIFPILFIFPLLIALRYQIIYGLVCNLAIYASFAGTLNRVDWLPYLVVSCLLVFIAGQFSSVWIMRQRRAEAMLEYTKNKLDYLSRAHYLATLSHQHLEHSLITKTITLRQIVAELRVCAIKESGRLNTQSLTMILNVLSQYCGLISACIVGVRKGKITDNVLVRIGADFLIDKKDALLQGAQELDAVRYQTVADCIAANSNYLAVAAIINSHGELLGFLIVKDMLFDMLNDVNMQTISVLLAYFANSISSYNKAPELLAAYPECPAEFAVELYNMIDLYTNLNIVSHIVCIYIKLTEQTDFLCAQLQSVHRGIDSGWAKFTDTQFIYINLMPFSGTVALEGYIRRIRGWLRSEFGVELNSAACYYREWKVTNRLPLDIITDCFNGK